MGLKDYTGAKDCAQPTLSDTSPFCFQLSTAPLSFCSGCYESSYKTTTEMRFFYFSLVINGAFCLNKTSFLKIRFLFFLTET